VQCEHGFRREDERYKRVFVSFIEYICHGRVWRGREVWGNMRDGFVRIRQVMVGEKDGDERGYMDRTCGRWKRLDWTRGGGDLQWQLI